MTRAQLSLVYFLIICFPAVCFAGGGPGHVPSFADTYKYWPNFFVFLALFIYLIKSPLVAFWASRREEIESGVMQGEKELAHAKQQLEQAQLRLSKLESEVSSITTSITQDAEREAEAIIAEAKERAARIAEQAKGSLEAEKKAAEYALRKELANYVVNEAEKRLRAEMSADSDAALRKATVGEMKSLIH